LKEVFQY
jgi:hypothetical protein